MNVVDTNIWIYCHDKRDATKQAKAKEAVAAALPLALPWQVGCEFIAATRKLEPFGFTKETAWDALAARLASGAPVVVVDHNQPRSLALRALGVLALAARGLPPERARHPVAREVNGHGFTIERLRLEDGERVQILLARRR